MACRQKAACQKGKSLVESLGNKVIVMLVGPAAIGKSTIMNEVAACDDRFSYVTAFTTRAKRPGEKSHYHFISAQEAKELIGSGQAITHFVHPTTHDIYGTTGASYRTAYNLLDTLSIAVETYRALPFKHHVTISLTASPDEWLAWFVDRYPTPTAEALKRLEEAKLSINWSLNDPHTQWLHNKQGFTGETARQLIDIATGSQVCASTPAEPRAMLELIEKGVWT